MHSYKLKDKVFYPVDAAPFIVVGIRENEVEIEGDFSGGTHNVIQKDWIKPEDLQPFDYSKMKVYNKDGHGYTTFSNTHI